MKNKVSPIPAGYSSVTPYLIVKNGKSAIDFYKKSFAAKEEYLMETQDGRIGHAELIIGNSKIMLGDECGEMGVFSPQTIGGTPISIHLYVEDVDAVVAQALANGAKLIRPIENMFYGDRSGGLEDPFGHKWYVATHIEDLTPAEIEKRAAEVYSKQKQK